MARTPAQALAWANSVSKGYGGLCLQFVRLAYGVGAKYPSAISAWNNAKVKHRTSSTAGIPVGAPIFMSGSKYGHIAIYAGNGNMRTTNSATNRIHTMSVASWTRMGYTLLGWTEDLNGVRVVPQGGSSGGGGGGGGLRVDGIWGPATTRALQKALGTTQDGVISSQYPFNAIKAIEGVQWNSRNPSGSDMVRALQRKLGVNVDGSLGPNTVKALQRYLGTTQDGVISKGKSQAVVALQQRLNAGNF